MLAAFDAYAGCAAEQCTLLVTLRRAQRRLGKGDRSIKLKRIIAGISPELAEIFGALRVRNRKTCPIGPSALALLASAAPVLDSDSLDLFVPVIVTAGGDPSAAIARWLAVAGGREHAVRAAEAAIATADAVLIERALRHERADARRLALLHMAQAQSDPLPPKILALAGDPSSRVRRALVSILAERPHPHHLRTLLTLTHDDWSSAEPYHDECESFDVAREAVIAVAVNKPLSDAVGNALVDLAQMTVDRTLGRYALIVAANCCGASVQERIFGLIDAPGARRTPLDAIKALADANAVAPCVVAGLTHAYLLEAPPVLAASAAQLIGAHAPVAHAVELFERVASSNSRRALLLVGAAAMASRDDVTATRILNLLEPGHPGRLLLSDSGLLPASILDDLGTVQLRAAVQERLGDRLAPP